MISHLLMKHMRNDNINDICVSIELKEMVYPFCFIREETPAYLVVDSTDDEGLEKVVIIMKKNIISVNVVYEQDLDKLFETDEFDEKEKRLYQ